MKTGRVECKGIILGPNLRRIIWVGNERIYFQESEYFKIVPIDGNSIWLIGGTVPGEEEIRITPNIKVYYTSYPKLNNDRYWDIFIATAEKILMLYNNDIVDISHKNEIMELFLPEDIYTIEKLYKAPKETAPYEILQEYFKLVPRLLKNMIYFVKHYDALFFETYELEILDEIKSIPIRKIVRNDKNMEPERIKSVLLKYTHNNREKYCILVGKDDNGMFLSTSDGIVLRDDPDSNLRWKTWSILAEYSLDKDDVVLYRWVGDGFIHPSRNIPKIEANLGIEIHNSGWIFINKPIKIRLVDGYEMEFQGNIPIVALDKNSLFLKISKSCEDLIKYMKSINSFKIPCQNLALVKVVSLNVDNHEIHMNFRDSVICDKNVQMKVDIHIKRYSINFTYSLLYIIPLIVSIFAFFMIYLATLYIFEHNGQGLPFIISLIISVLLALLLITILPHPEYYEIKVYIYSQS